MDTLPTLYTDKRFMLELAMHLEGSGEPLADILNKYEVSPSDLQRRLRDKSFATELAKLREEVVNNGLTFRLKARAMAEEFLKTTWNIVQDKAVSPAVRADLIKSTVQWGDLVPKQAKTDAPTDNVKIIINLSSDNEPKPVVIDSSALPAE